MDLIYHIIISAVLIGASPFILLRMAVDTGFRSDILERLRGAVALPAVSGCVWVHAASVGEVAMAAILIRNLKESGDTRPIVLSTFTRTGYQQAIKEDLCPAFRLPPDFPWWTRPLFKKLQPALLILIEAELWPSLLRQCKRGGVPVLLANGRMTEKAFSRYKSFQWFFRWITEGIARFSMRSQTDADRILTLGVDQERVIATGNIKFDALAGKETELKEVQEESQLVVFGSTRPGDEGPVMEAVLQLQKDFKDLQCVIAPRHMERCREVEDLIREYGVDYTLHSKLSENSGGSNSLILLDTLGELNLYYARATVAFVGGGFNPRFGGQNILEPAGHSVPVIFGKHMNNFEEEAKLLVESGGGIQIGEPKEIYTVLHRLLTDKEERKRRGQSAGEAVRQNRGTVQRTIKIIKSISS